MEDEIVKHQAEAWCRMVAELMVEYGLEALEPGEVMLEQVQNFLRRRLGKPAPATAGEQEWAELLHQAAAYARCNCPDAPEYHSNCQRHLKPILDKLDAVCKASLATERERYDDLRRSVMDLSHPNCKVLLNERNEARAQLAAAQEEIDTQAKTVLDALTRVAALEAQLGKDQRCP